MTFQRAFYNEIDRYCCAWLSNLMDAGEITPGVIDDRPIQELTPDDVRGYERVHFFAGVAGWDIALNLAGWGTRFVWTGSCPCQPFSSAGAGKAGDDERHLWPAWASLIRECRPRTVFGEQVEAAVGWGWLDLVFTDLEAEGYACGSAVLPACGVGAPHIRQRLWFVAQSSGAEWRQGRPEWAGASSTGPHAEPSGSSAARVLADAERSERGAGRGGRNGEAVAQREGRADADRRGLSVGLADADGRDAGPEGLQRGGEQRQLTQDGGARGMGNASSAGSRRHGRAVLTAQGEGEGERRGVGRISHEPVASSDAGCMEHAESIGLLRRQDDKDEGRRQRSLGQGSTLGGFWSDAEWLPCSDGKARPVEPGPQRMADGLLASPSRLCPDRVAQIEKEVSDASRGFDAGKALHDLWLSLWPQALRQSAGGPDGVHGAGVLLALLRQLTEQGWSFSKSVPRASTKASDAGMRGVWRDEAATCSSCGRGLDEQRSDKCPNPLHLLSSILARHAQAAWGEAFKANARACHPLAHGVARRPSKLRAYGNAIVPPLAAEFVAAFMGARQ